MDARKQETNESLIGEVTRWLKASRVNVALVVLVLGAAVGWVVAPALGRAASRAPVARPAPHAGECPAPAPALGAAPAPNAGPSAEPAPSSASDAGGATAAAV